MKALKKKLNRRTALRVESIWIYKLKAVPKISFCELCSWKRLLIECGKGNISSSLVHLAIGTKFRPLVSTHFSEAEKFDSACSATITFFFFAVVAALQFGTQNTRNYSVPDSTGVVIISSEMSPLAQGGLEFTSKLLH